MTGYNISDTEPSKILSQGLKRNENLYPIVFYKLEDGTLVIDTGGTFGAEKYDDPFNPPKKAEMLKDSMVETVLEAIGEKIVKKAEWPELSRKDSKEFRDKELKEIFVTTLNMFNADKIIVIHGTDAIIESAKAFESFLSEDKPNFPVKVVFTGAYIPPANGLNNSDGPNNLKTALNEVRSMISPNGVAIALDAVCDAKAKSESEKEANIYRDLNRVVKVKNNDPEAKNPYKILYMYRPS